MNNDTVLDFGEENLPPKPEKRYRHPFVSISHVLFRTAALVTYLICGMLNIGFVTSFIFIVLLLSMDFWCVKNITGRFMVGLMWSNVIKEDGSSEWKFESNKNVPTTPFESRLFWIVLVVFPLLWVLMFFTSLFSLHLQWLMVVVVALILNCTNLWGYTRCKFSSNKEMGSAATKFFGAKLFSSVNSYGAGSSSAQSA